MNDIIFVHPYWLFFLEVLPLMIIFYFRNFRKQRPVIQFSSLTDLDIMRSSLRKRLIHIPFVLRLMSVALIIIALAEPRQEKLQKLLDKTPHGTIYMIDVTRPMLDRDLLPNRLEAVKSSLVHFIRRLVPAGIVIMDSAGRILDPVSPDTDALENSIAGLNANPIVATASLDAALKTSITLLDSIKPGHRSILCVTSGSGFHLADLTALNRLINENRIALSVITVASEGTISTLQKQKGKLVYREAVSDIDETGIAGLCEQSGGAYYRATTSQELDESFLRFTAASSKEKTVFNRSQNGIFSFTALAVIILITELSLRYTIFRFIP